MSEICVKSITLRYKEHLIKESKTFIVPADVYRHIIAEISEDPANVDDRTINCNLRYVPNDSEAHITENNKNLIFKKPLSSIIPAAFSKLMMQQGYYLRVYWDSDKNILTFEEEADKN